MNSNGIYIYGIVPNFYPLEQFFELEKMGLSAISFQNISAIVSESVVRSLDNLSQESLGQILVHHQRTIEKLMELGFTMILPMRLATIVNSKQEVWNMLDTGYELIIDTMKKIENMIEIDIVATWDDISDVLDEVSVLPEIVILKESLQNKEGGPTQTDLMEIGFMVKQKVDAKKDEMQQAIYDELSSLFAAKKKHEVMNDQMVTNTAFLLNRKYSTQFENVIERLDEKWNGYLNFKLVGPLPCYSFFTLELTTMDFEQVEKAKDLLGLPNVASEIEIRKAFHDKVKLAHPDTNHGDNHNGDFNTVNLAHQTLLNYLSVAKRKSHDEKISLVKSEENQNLIMLKIRE